MLAPPPAPRLTRREQLANDAQAIEALLSGAYCFLGQEEWIAVLYSGIIRSEVGFSTCTEEIVSFLLHMVEMANLTAACTSLILRSKAGPAWGERRNALLQSVHTARKRLEIWRLRWVGSFPVRPTADDARLKETLGQGDLEIYLGYHCFLLMFNRLHVALGGRNSQVVEAKCQKIAYTLCNDPGVRQIRAGGAGAIITLAVAKSIVETAELWRGFSEAETTLTKPRLISPGAFRRWIEQLGIHVPLVDDPL